MKGISFHAVCLCFLNALSVCTCYSAGLKNPCLYRHDLLALHSRQLNRFSLNVNKIPEKLVPRKFAMTTKVGELAVKTADVGDVTGD